MANIVITELMDENSVQALERDFDVLYDPDLWKNNDGLADILQTATGMIVRNRTQVTSDLLERAEALRVIGRLGVGLDNIDLECCRSKGIEVFPAIGANARAVAEYVIATVYIMMRRCYFSNSQVIDGLWPRQALIGNEIAGKTMGIVGFGSIGQITAELAVANGMRAIATDPILDEDSPAWDKAERFDFDDLLSESDVVSLHIPLTDATRNKIDRQALSLMGKGSYLVNTARGGIVDEAALIEALESGNLAGAAVDVFSEEPLDANSGSRFRNVPNLILTPHVAGISAESNVRVSQLTADNVRSALQRIS